MVREVLTLARLQRMAADDAAALFMVRRQDGDWPHERELFENWLESNAANEAAWLRIQKGWDAFEGAKSDELVDAMHLHARASGASQPGRWYRIAAAAALVLAIGTGTMLVADQGWSPWGDGGRGTIAGSTGEPGLASTRLDYINGQGAVKRIVLPDGSRITLDAGTHVTAELTAGRRSLRLLQGRAFFDVRPDAARPFSVRANAVEVTALGTRFDVQIDGPEQRVMLFEGKLSVALDGATGSVLLKSGQRLIVRDGRPYVDEANSDEGSSWRSGFATFEDTKLSEVAATFKRYSGDRLIIRDPRIAELRVTGRFRATSPERFGRALEQIHPVRVVRRGPDSLEIVAAR